MQVWDIATQQCEVTLSHHNGKVQAVAWNPAEAAVLLSGGFDKRACLVRARHQGLVVLICWRHYFRRRLRMAWYSLRLPW